MGACVWGWPLSRGPGYAGPPLWDLWIPMLVTPHAHPVALSPFEVGQAIGLPHDQHCVDSDLRKKVNFQLGFLASPTPFRDSECGPAGCLLL